MGFGQVKHPLPWGLVCAPLSAWAHAPVYFDLAGLIFLVLGLGIGLVALVGYRIARWRGVLLAFFLLGGFVAKCAYDDKKNDQAQRVAVQADEEFERQICLERAGIEIKERRAHGGPVAVRALWAPVGPDGSLFRMDPERLETGVSVIGFMPSSGRAPGTLYVYIERLTVRYPSGGREKEGLWVEISDDQQKVLATLTDFRSGEGWCLGSTPPSSIENFVRDVTGRTLGLLPVNETGDAKAPTTSLVARLVELERVQRLFTLMRTSPIGDGPLVDLRPLLPPTAQCDPIGHEWRCQAGTTTESRMQTAALPFGLIETNRWLVPKSVMPSHALNLMELDLTGTLKRGWHIRLPIVDGNASEVTRLLELKKEGELLRFRLGWQQCASPAEPEVDRLCFDRSATYEVRLSDESAVAPRSD